ncbi:MAG: hypothetical protein R3B09_12630 [Nannocystaceae bacterium]
MESVRALRPEDHGRARPIYCVWETTLRCDHACAHCGSRAGDPRETELDTAALLEVADALIRLGTRGHAHRRRGVPPRRHLSPHRAPRRYAASG